MISKNKTPSALVVMVTERSANGYSFAMKFKMNPKNVLNKKKRKKPTIDYKSISNDAVMTDKKQYRNWVFTVNNYGATDIQIFGEVECRFVCYGKEVGESGTPHLQGLIIFDKRGKTLAGLKKVHPTAHWEPMKGTIDQAYAYCVKDGDVYERGEKPMNQVEKENAARDPLRNDGMPLRKVASKNSTQKISRFMSISMRSLPISLLIGMSSITYG